MPIDIAGAIRALRHARGMTQEELASAAHISKQAISMYEIGQRRPSYEVLEILADVFNVPMSYFLNKDELPDNIRDSLEFWEIREAVRDNPDMLTLFGLAKKCSPKELKQTIRIIKSLIGDDD